MDFGGDASRRERGNSKRLHYYECGFHCMAGISHGDAASSLGFNGSDTLLTEF